jgi:hypothetical protein
MPAISAGLNVPVQFLLIVRLSHPDPVFVHAPPLVRSAGMSSALLSTDCWLCSWRLAKDDVINQLPGYCIVSCS